LKQQKPGFSWELSSCNQSHGLLENQPFISMILSIKHKGIIWYSGIQ
jgi:hypothetical protein